MAAIHIRDLPDDIHEALKERAEKAGRSLSAEVRRILTLSVRRKGAMGEVVREIDEIRRTSHLAPGPRDDIDRWIREDRER